MDIPQHVAKKLSEEFSKDQLLVVGWDNAAKELTVTVYGKTKTDQLAAELASKLVQEALNWPKLK